MRTFVSPILFGVAAVAMTFTYSSSPADDKKVEEKIENSKTTVKFDGQPERLTRLTEQQLTKKSLAEGEEIWFEGADSKQVQGWVLRPHGWTEGKKKKYPVVLLIHGGNMHASCLSNRVMESRRPSRCLGRSVVHPLEWQQYVLVAI